jgi:hypothetical protein
MQSGTALVRVVGLHMPSFPERSLLSSGARARTHSTLRRRSRVVACCAVVLACGLGLAAAPASAQSAPSTSQVARDLFERGKVKWAAGEYEEAAALLAASHQQTPRAGTLMLMADAYERLGRLRSARDTFRSAGALARKENNSGLTHRAETREAALIPRLPQIEVRIVQPLPKGVLVTLNGAELPRAQLNVPTALDAGSYRLEAHAPGYQPFGVELQISNEGARALGARLVPISLVRAQTGADPAEPDADPFDPAGTRRELGFWIGGAGAAVALASALSMIVALDKNGASHARCGSAADPSNVNVDENVCSRRGAELRDQARVLAHVASVGGVLGIAGVGTGLALYFSRGSDREPEAAGLRWSAEF